MFIWIHVHSYLYFNIVGIFCVLQNDIFQHFSTFCDIFQHILKCFNMFRCITTFIDCWRIPKCCWKMSFLLKNFNTRSGEGAFLWLVLCFLFCFKRDTALLYIFCIKENWRCNVYNLLNRTNLFPFNLTTQWTKQMV